MIRAFTTLFVMAILIMLAGLMYIPAPEKPNYDELCPDDNAIVVNGEFIECMKDHVHLASTMWTPSTGLAPMKPLPEKAFDDSWLDGP